MAEELLSCFAMTGWPLSTRAMTDYQYRPTLWTGTTCH